MNIEGPPIKEFPDCPVCKGRGYTMTQRGAVACDCPEDAIDWDRCDNDMDRDAAVGAAVDRENPFAGKRGQYAWRVHRMAVLRGLETQEPDDSFHDTFHYNQNIDSDVEEDETVCPDSWGDGYHRVHLDDRGRPA